MRPRRSVLPTLALAASTLAAAAAPLRAQGSVSPADSLRYAQRASVNLLGIPFGLVSGEYEGFVSEEISLGGAAGIDENSESWLEVKGRFYPAARGPRGLSVGMSLGLARLRAFTEEDCFIVCTEADGPLATGFTVGAVVDYQWVLGRRERFYIGTGIGAKRVFGLDDETTADGTTADYRKVLPSFRLQTGIVF